MILFFQKIVFVKLNFNMKNLLLGFFLFHFICSNAQNHLEINIKPTELIFQNIEWNLGFGNSAYSIGAILGYRPSTQNSGLVKSPVSGLGGSYGNQHFNRLYNAYTLGLYYKKYFSNIFFLEGNYFYRHWYFNNKKASFDNDEGYRFDATRTEKVNVHCFKVLIGITTRQKTENRTKFYYDLFLGLGIREITRDYKTFHGTVKDVYYDYLHEQRISQWITPQLGLKIGLTR